MYALSRSKPQSVRVNLLVYQEYTTVSLEARDGGMALLLE